MDEPIMITRKESLFAMKEIKDEIRGAFVIVLLEGQIIVEVQLCNSCRPKTSILTTAGSNLYIPPKSTYRIRNSQLLKAEWIEVHQNPDML